MKIKMRMINLIIGGFCGLVIEMVNKVNYNTSGIGIIVILLSYIIFLMECKK